jgi:RND family efflux transporter MFP subunit
MNYIDVNYRRRACAAFATWLGFTLTAIGCGKQNAAVVLEDPKVTVQHPLEKLVDTYKQFTGNAKAVEEVDLKARVKGFLTKVPERDGMDVEVNEIVFQIEKESYEQAVKESQAKVEEAQASLEKSKKSQAVQIAAAQLAFDQAQLVLSDVERSRQRALVGRKASSQEDLDKAVADFDKARAQVELDKAKLEQERSDFKINIAAAEAALAAAVATLDNAKINLNYCDVRSPIEGRLSRRYVDRGNLVGNTDATLLATVVRYNPIRVYVNVSESDLLLFRRMNAQGKRPDYREVKVPAELQTSDEKGFQHVGFIDYVDPEVDPGTGTIQARSTFPNAEKPQILPGFFVRVRVPLYHQEKALVVPDVAMMQDKIGHYLLSVDSDDVVQIKRVNILADLEGAYAVSGEGLSSQDRIVVNGVQQAVPGNKVQPKAAEPKNPSPAVPNEASDAPSQKQQTKS